MCYFFSSYGLGVFSRMFLQEESFLECSYMPTGFKNVKSYTASARLAEWIFGHNCNQMDRRNEKTFPLLQRSMKKSSSERGRRGSWAKRKTIGAWELPKREGLQMWQPGSMLRTGDHWPLPISGPIMASQHMLASTALVTSKRTLDPQCDYCSSTWLCLCRKAFLNAQNYFKKFINSTFYISEFTTLKCFSLFLIKNIIP